MKKVVLLSIIALISFSVKAQIPGFELKFMGGINMPSFEMNQATASAQKLNYALSLDAAIGKKNYLQAGISMRNYSGDFTVAGISSDILIPSFGIHAFYGHQFLDLKLAKLRGFVGPNYELLDTPKSKGFVIDPSAYNPYVFNFVVGGELKVLSFLLFSLQYEMGVTDMMPNNSIKNNVFIAKVGISIL